MSGSVRTIISSGIAFVRGVEANKSASALTLDHLLQEHITDLQQGQTSAVLDGKGEQVGSRLSKYDQLSKLQSDFDQAIQAVLAAGDDPAKLEALGVYEVDQETKSDDEPDTSTSEAAQ